MILENAVMELAEIKELYEKFKKISNYINFQDYLKALFNNLD